MTDRARGFTIVGGFALVAVALVGWLLRPTAAPPPRPVSVGADPAPPPDGVAGQPPTPAGSRDEVLDQVEAAEAAALGVEEAARRRRQRERMLELRAEEH